jgi:hypothetical protein
VSAAVAARQALRERPAKPEPEPPAPATRLVFHPPGSTPVAPVQPIERRFAPDDLLSDAVRPARTQPKLWKLITFFLFKKGQNTQTSSHAPLYNMFLIDVACLIGCGLAIPCLHSSLYRS